MGFSKDGPERKMFADFYRLMEKYWEPPKDIDMITMADDVYEFQKKYTTDEDHLAEQLTALIVERVWEYHAGIRPLCSMNRNTRDIIAAIMEGGRH